MPSPSSNLLPGSLSLSQIQKFIPKQWKKPNPNSKKKTSPLPISLDFFEIDRSMVDTLFTSLKELASHGHLSKAFRTFSLIQRCCPPSSCYEIVVQSLSCLVFGCKEFDSFPEGKQLHGYIVSLGVGKDPILVPKLVMFYSGFKLLGEAHLVAESYGGENNPVPWNVLIGCYVNAGLCKEGLYAFKQMVRRRILPDHFTYPSVLKACGEEMNLGFGREVHKSMMDAGSCYWNLFVQNALVSMYGKCGELGNARMVFDRMTERDVISWNSMISGYASIGMWKEAFELFESMRGDDVEVNYITWNNIAGGCLSRGNYKRALELTSDMRRCGIHLDPVALINGLGACSHLMELRLGKEIHGLAIRNSSYEYVNVKNALITMYSRCKDLRYAHSVFCLMETRSVITWNSMISGYTHWDQSEEASFLLRKMLLSGFEPNYVTVASILPLCARIANLQHGKEFHCYITRREEFTDYLLLWNTLVDMYARSGKILAAQRLFDLLSNKDEVTYTSLIAGYGIQGMGHTAIELFEEMIDLKIMPDHVTMIAVLSACSHYGLIGRGQVLFEKMSTVYHVAPRLEHFSCMVDLYGRAGLLKEAVEMIRRMPYQPTAAMWATIIGACRVHGKTELGEWAAEKLLELKPQHSGYYVLIANMYAAVGCWQKLATVRTYMRDLGVQKDPGCAWLDFGAGFSPFLVGDTSNTKADEIYPLLGGLSKQLTEAGHVMSDDDLVAEVC